MAKSSVANTKLQEIERLAHDLSCVNGTELGGAIDSLNRVLKLTATYKHPTLVESALSRMQEAKDKMEGLICDLETAVENPKVVSIRSTGLPEAIKNRIEEARQIIFQAHSLSGVAACAVLSEKETDEYCMTTTLTMVSEMLDKVAAMIDPMALAREVPNV